MVDIIDVMLAKALSSNGQIDAAAARAQKAVSDAEIAVSNIETITQQTEDNNALAAQSAEVAQAALDKANQASQTIDEALENLDTTVSIETIDSEIKKLAVELVENSSNSLLSYNLKTEYPDDSVINNQNPLIKFYTNIGENTDGGMTQKAIKTYVEGIKTSLETEIQNIPAGGTISFENSDVGKIVVVGSNGNIISGQVTEKDIIDALIKSDSYSLENVVGLEIDYENKLFTRLYDAANAPDFLNYKMYSRIRCNVTDDGQILAFEGEVGYKNDGTNGQVMVYQPKFYYKRIPIKLANKIVRKEKILLSETAQPGFKLHPLFIDENGNELEYVLLSAYNGSTYDVSVSDYNRNDSSDVDFNNDKLSSIAGVKPISGVRNALSAANSEKLANNRGSGWHITTMAAQSAEQMLEMVEFGTMNIQSAFEAGVVNIQSNSSYNCASITGSTNSNGAATSTTNEINGTTTEYSVAGRRAIAYRGVENPWGNIWNFIGDTTIVGNGSSNGGVPYINNESVGFSIPSGHNWISGMGYGNETYDWVYMPAECMNANSALPVGDSLWATSNLNTTNGVLVGGYCGSGDEAGPFYYGCDRAVGHTATNYGARLIYIPTPGTTVYNNNIEKWRLAI